jgi:hypothetical protein
MILTPVSREKFIHLPTNTLYEFLKDKSGNVKYVRITTSEGYNNDFLKQA